MSPRKMIVLPWLIWALVLGASIAAALYASGVQAQAPRTFSSEDANGKITLVQAPCEKAGPWFGNWRAATWLYKGKHYDACWLAVQTSGGSQTILVIDSDGQVSNIDPQRFRPDEGI